MAEQNNNEIENKDAVSEVPMDEVTPCEPSAEVSTESRAASNSPRHPAPTADELKTLQMFREYGLSRNDLRKLKWRKDNFGRGRNGRGRGGGRGGHSRENLNHNFRGGSFERKFTTSIIGFVELPLSSSLNKGDK